MSTAGLCSWAPSSLVLKQHLEVFNIGCPGCETSQEIQKLDIEGPSRYQIILALKIMLTTTYYF